MLGPITPRALAAAMLLAFPLAFVDARPAQARSEAAIVQSATDVLTQFLALRVKEIPESLLAEAQAVAIIPDVIKVGFVVGGQHGKGIVVIRDPKTGGWTAPSFISLTGGSIGWQIGAQASDVVLVFKTQRSVEGLLEGKFTLGADAAVAAGPVGRQAKAATDAQLKAEIYSYARARGLFAGVAVDGSVLSIEPAMNIAYYGGNGVAGVAQPIPEGALKLVQYIAQATASANNGGPIPQPPAADAQPPFSPTGPELGTPMAIPATPIPTTPIPANPIPDTATPQPGFSPGAQPAFPAPAPLRDLRSQAPSPDEVRAQLAQSAAALNPLLDPTWQRYLALPGEVYERGQHPSPTAIRGTIDRFEAVAADNRYRDLNSRPEFNATRDALRAYYDALSTSASPRLALPPPPAGVK